MANKKYTKKEEKLLQIYDNVLPPNAEEIEKTILGTILIESESIYKVASELKPNLFFNVKCQKTCEVIYNFTGLLAFYIKKQVRFKFTCNFIYRFWFN